MTFTAFEHFALQIFTKLTFFHESFGALLNIILNNALCLPISILICYISIYILLYCGFYFANIYNIKNIYIYITLYTLSFLFFFIIDYILFIILPDELFLQYLRYVANITIIALLSIRFVKLFTSLHDWSIGIPININFAKEIVFWITYCFNLIIFFIPLYKIALFLEMYTLAICLLWIFYCCLLIFITLFIRRNSANIIYELNNQFAITLDIQIFYICLIFFSLLSFAGINKSNILLSSISSIFTYLGIKVSNFLIKNIYTMYQQILKPLNEEINTHYILTLNYNIFFLCGFIIFLYSWYKLLSLQYLFELSIIRYFSKLFVSLLVILIFFEFIYLFLARFSVNLLLKIELSSFAAERNKNSIITLFRFTRTVLNCIKGIILCFAILIISGFDTEALGSSITWLFAALSFVLQAEIKGLLNVFGLLLSNSISIGDLIEVDSITGEIEEITMKYIKIRSIDGALTIIPYYNIHNLINRSSDYSYIIINIAVARYVSHLKVEKAIEHAVCNIKRNFTETIKLGAIEHCGIVEAHFKRIILQSRIKCSPGRQFIAKRALNLELLQAIKLFNIDLGEEGIIYNYNTSISNSTYKLL